VGLATRPRLWICPTGLFTFLPLHSAGVYLGRNQDCLSDYCVPSYTPTVKTLQNARRQDIHIPLRNSKVLLAAVPVPYKQSTLPGVLKEMSAVKDVLDPEMIVSVEGNELGLDKPDGSITASAVLDNVHQANILHLACHGHQVS
jgi:hypothetical protein